MSSPEDTMTTTTEVRTILLLEDDPAISELLGWALEDAGYRVDRATTVAQALNLADGRWPDLILADLLLPDGLGADVIRTLRASERQTCPRAIVMSAHPRACEYAAMAGAEICLPKPFDLDDLFSRVEHLLSPPA